MGWNDYGARNYDALLGRWMGVDELAEEQVSFTPYHYVYDNPMVYYDSDGKWPVPIITGLIGAGIGTFSGLMQGKSGKEILAKAAGGFVTGAAVGMGAGLVGLAGGAASIFTATTAEVAAGSAFVGAAGSFYAGLIPGVIGEGLGNLVEQGINLKTGASNKFDEKDLTLSMSLSIAGPSMETGLGLIGNALGKKAAIRTLTNEVLSQSNGQITKREAKSLAKRTYNLLDKEGKSSANVSFNKTKNGIEHVGYILIDISKDKFKAEANPPK